MSRQLEVAADLCTQVERRLKCHVESVPEARRIVAHVLDEAGFGVQKAGLAVRDDALLVTSEMITNAVRACRVTLTLRLDVHRTWLQVSVSDDSPAPAVQRRPGPEETGGRGVDIMATLSTEWGQTTWDGTTKTVWSRLDVPLEAALSLTCDEP